MTESHLGLPFSVAKCLAAGSSNTGGLLVSRSVVTPELDSEATGCGCGLASPLQGPIFCHLDHSALLGAGLIDVAEVAYLLGYEDSNSFYRAFRTWEVPPGLNIGSD